VDAKTVSIQRLLFSFPAGDEAEKGIKGTSEVPSQSKGDWGGSFLVLFTAGEINGGEETLPRGRGGVKTTCTEKEGGFTEGPGIVKITPIRKGRKEERYKGKKVSEK